MANEKTLDILKEMKADPKAKELFEGMEKPTSFDEMVAAYVQVAEQLGYDITAKDIRKAVEQDAARIKEKTDKVVSDMEALDDDDLEGVAGGVYTKYDGIVKHGCRNDFTDPDCNWFDACDKFNEIYYGCTDKYYGECRLNKYF